MNLAVADLNEDIFDEISDLVHTLCGICLHDGKKQLVKARLNRRLRELQFRDFRQYLDFLHTEAGKNEITGMLDAISTNQTSFFREGEHFRYLSEQAIPAIVSRSGGDKRLRAWSAGCSSGEEPYSIAITLRKSLPQPDNWDARILATDISTRVLATGRAGRYDAARVEPVPPYVRERAFNCVQPRPPRQYEVLPVVRKMVHFARLNLMDSWPMQGPFDFIFCRNVMIYFDRETRERLVGRFWDLLAPEGKLFVGHSESLTGIRHDYKYVQPTVYEKS